MPLSRIFSAFPLGRTEMVSTSDMPSDPTRVVSGYKLRGQKDGSQKSREESRSSHLLVLFRNDLIPSRLRV